MKLMNYEETASLLGVAVGTLYARVHRQMIPHKRLGSRLVRFDLEEIERWISARSVDDCRLQEDFPEAEAGK